MWNKDTLKKNFQKENLKICIKWYKLYVNYKVKGTY